MEQDEKLDFTFKQLQSILKDYNNHPVTAVRKIEKFFSIADALRQLMIANVGERITRLPG